MNTQSNFQGLVGGSLGSRKDSSPHRPPSRPVPQGTLWSLSWDEPSCRLAPLILWNNFSPIMFCQLSSGLLPLEHLWRWSKFLVFLLVGIAPDFYFLGSLTWEDSPRRGLSWSLSLFSFRFLLPSFLPLPHALQIPLAESPPAGRCTASPLALLSPSRAVEPISLTPMGAHSAQKLPLSATVITFWSLFFFEDIYQLLLS